MPDESKHCAVYLRISLDRDMDGLAIDRQRDECMRIVKERGLHVYREYVDQSKSATNKAKHRPAYDQMFSDYKSGQFTNIVCSDLDRLIRQPRQLEDWIDAAQAQRGNLVLVTANGEADLSTDGGRLYARVKTTVAANEVERKGARQKAAHRQRAQQGRPPTGVRPIGYRNDGSIVEGEAEVVRAIYRAFDAGSSVNAIMKALSGMTGDNIPSNVPQTQPHTVTLVQERNARLRQRGLPEKPVPEGRAWARTSVLGILRNPRYAAYSTYTNTYDHETRISSRYSNIVRDANGDPVEGVWEPIVDRELWERVQTRLDDPQRVCNRDRTARKHLGTSLYVCGICGKPVKSYTQGYRCPDHFTRKRSRIDQYVLDVVRARLSQPDIADLMLSPNDDDNNETKRIDDEISRHRARILRAESDYNEGLIEARDLKRVRDKASAAIDILETKRARLMSNSTPADVTEVAAADDPVALFDALDLGRKQAVIRTLMTVKLKPHPKGDKTFDGSDVLIEWKT